jgi:hypothetical protein
MLMKEAFDSGTKKSPPKHVPTVNECLRFFGKRGIA